jgi:mortality factor 4-like protein 1
MLIYGQEDQYNSKPAIRIPISDTLKSILVDDWENITKNLSLVCVPAARSVTKILDDYMAFEKNRREGGGEVDGEVDGTSDSRSVELLEEVVAGLREYFNRALGRILLYRYERGQYEDILARINDPNDELHGKQIADVYGAEHLLRLFGKAFTFVDFIMLISLQFHYPSLLPRPTWTDNPWLVSERNLAL